MPITSVLRDRRKLEAKLRRSLLRDRVKSSRRVRLPDGSVLVRPSGTSYGLAIALALLTGEDELAIMNRVGGL